MRVTSDPKTWAREDSHVKMAGCSSYLLGVKNEVLVPLMVLSFKRSTAGVFVVPFRVLLSQKIRLEVMCYVKIGTS